MQPIEARAFSLASPRGDGELHSQARRLRRSRAISVKRPGRAATRNVRLLRRCGTIDRSGPAVSIRLQECFRSRCPPIRPGNSPRHCRDSGSRSCPNRRSAWGHASAPRPGTKGPRASTSPARTVRGGIEAPRHAAGRPVQAQPPSPSSSRTRPLGLGSAECSSISSRSSVVAKPPLERSKARRT